LAFISIEEALIHTILVGASLAVLLVSVRAFMARGGGRYFALMVAFVFMTLSQVVDFVESYYSTGFIIFPVLDVHLSHLLDLVMILSFGAALLIRQERNPVAG